MMRNNGLNPALRGYSPSKPYWKQGGPVSVGSKSSGHKQPLYGNNNMHVPGPSQGVSGSGGNAGSSFGGSQNPNIYTRSTKHTPSYK